MLEHEHAIDALLPPGWELEDELLICPCGEVIELDGACPRGHVSPLRGIRLI